MNDDFIIHDKKLEPEKPAKEPFTVDGEYKLHVPDLEEVKIFTFKNFKKIKRALKPWYEMIFKK